MLADLTADLLGRGYGVRSRVRGSSMHPTIKFGETIVVQPAAPGDLQPGDIAVYRHGENLVAHRATRCAGAAPDRALITVCGDAPWMTEERIERGQILGRVTAVERKGRTVDLVGRRARLRRSVAVWLFRFKYRLYCRLIRAEKPETPESLSLSPTDEGCSWPADSPDNDAVASPTAGAP